MPKPIPRDPFTFSPPAETTKSHFSASPRAQEYLQNTELHPFTTEARKPKGQSTADRLIANTLATGDTIAAWQSLYKPAKASGDGNDGKEGERPYGEAINLLKIGEGVNGHIDTAHGGFLGTVLDECIGNVGEYERPEGTRTMTAYLNVNYKRPVPTPSVIIVRAWLDRIEGRKMFGKGVIEDEEGRICVTAETLFLTVKEIASGKARL
ncbi:uncharacterized protein L3040_003004 [Drepanopeziza brunnea f. sp. 'multigermtubi']|uniref:Thioesterase superfamily protein n=1 Tax=Marssonina brunnea f. sp. multigermtubi (strain MB_m1) TaxID=1072389 RepID=K1W7W1_MARBU|nr:thioesterase superfamily protein [Drepanopeziza brunnea f. sp. 'multigermtubi' MB_m1]EKD13200.1 thioesterase superfamily protein [Drepanopeziza brunnea f. sp. 'multigermtubi' MB_m1]KAJ5047162.1 hypothetical protein L3040_003004 [Drepanopeziza brunnea f. sp. 'multigermtubi']